jgi:CRISPR/Cas system Type II protein with McrA/HNH and RuvC-like nuclease domain
MDKFYKKKHLKSVLNDLSMNKDLESKVYSFRESFIDFACLERMNYKPNIQLEVQDYFLRSRLYNLNKNDWIHTIKMVFKRDNYTCQYCGKSGCKLEADHIIPFSKGGGNNIENLTTSCVKCNRQKKDKTVEDFVKWRLNHN